MSEAGSTVARVTVMTDLDDIADALSGTVLDGHAIEEGIGSTVLVHGIDPTRLLDAWRAARSVLDVTGRWPVFTGPGELYHEPSTDEVVQLAEAAVAVDPWSVYRTWVDDEPLDEERVDRWVSAFFDADVAARVRRELSFPTTDAAVDRWIWDTLLADTGLRERAHTQASYLVGTGTWHLMREVQLVLLPTPHQWLSPLWTSYFGATCANGVEGLAAAIRQWEQQWGAELVACWGTMLQFVVARQPAEDEQAWQLARQLMAVGGSLQMQPWELALAVTRSDAWFLHDRP